MYTPTVGLGAVMEYLGTTGLDSLAGADILKVAPQGYSSTVNYPNTKIAQKLRGVAQVHLADLGTRIFYWTMAASIRTPASLVRMPSCGKRCLRVDAFFADLREHDAADNVLMFLFTEFGRRVHDNGSGTDHGAGWGGLCHR